MYGPIGRYEHFDRRVKSKFTGGKREKAAIT
jgi:hypothetical protein